MTIPSSRTFLSSDSSYKAINTNAEQKIQNISWRLLQSTVFIRSYAVCWLLCWS